MWRKNYFWSICLAQEQMLRSSQWYKIWFFCSLRILAIVPWKLTVHSEKTHVIDCKMQRKERVLLRGAVWGCSSEETGSMKLWCMKTEEEEMKTWKERKCPRDRDNRQQKTNAILPSWPPPTLCSSLFWSFLQAVNEPGHLVPTSRRATVLVLSSPRKPWPLWFSTANGSFHFFLYF